MRARARVEGMTKPFYLARGRRRFSTGVRS